MNQYTIRDQGGESPVEETEPSHGEVEEGTHQLIHEWIVNDTNDWDTFKSKSNRGTNHRISMDLSSASFLRYGARRHILEARTGGLRTGEGIEEVKAGGGQTKLVVPSIGLILV